MSAKLHGKEIKAQMKPLNITREKREEYDSQAASLLKRMKDKYNGEGSRTTNKN